MKIVCDSCGAKYSIADEKVAGRVFKIRCKKCGAAIVVKGDAGQAAEAAPAAAGGFDYGGEAVWHTVVDGEQQGPFAPAQLGSMISAGTIGWDAYVWREGFDDWKPAQDIEELVQAIMNPGGAPAAGGAAEDPFSDQPTMMGGGGGGAKSSPAPAKASKRDAGADLFAQSEASPFGGGGGDDDDVVASAPSPRVGANQAMTGARNENSVLFSLSNLQALATGSPGGGSASPSPSASKASGPAPKAGMAAGEGSGLIDIRALASATGLTGGGGGLSPGPAIGGAPPKLDELISIGAPTGGLGGALGAPVIIAEKPEPARGGGGGMIAAAAIVAVALLGGAGIFAYVSLNQPDPAATTPATATIAPTTPPPVTAAAPPPTTTVAAVDTTAPPATGAAPPTTTTASTGGSGGHRPRSGSSTGSTGSTGSTASADPPPATTARTSGSSGGDRSIDDLLSSALGPTTGRPRTGSGSSTTPAPSAPAADSSLPATPGRSDVVSAMTGVRSDVTACGGGQHGLATVAVAVAGGTGRVSSATVSGQFAGTPIGSCVARAVRGATFPHFRNPTFSFNYPFQL